LVEIKTDAQATQLTGILQMEQRKAMQEEKKKESQ
jgi:hypothetical protein